MAATIKTSTPAHAAALAFAGLATASISMGGIWSLSTGYTSQPMWPIPGLYLVEAVVLPALVLWAVIVADYRGAWLAVGALATLALLGAMSIGLYVALALIFLVPASILGDDGQSTLSQKVVAFLLGGLFQGGVSVGVSFSPSCVARCQRRMAAEVCFAKAWRALPQQFRLKAGRLTPV